MIRYVVALCLASRRNLWYSEIATHPSRAVRITVPQSFDIQIIHWPTLSAFTAYLQGVPRPSWCAGITNHNTYIPNELQWRGLASMQSMQATYISKGWSAGPHLYLCAEAPNPADTGIWQMTPLAHPGIHAGACNAAHLGVENCGDFNARPPSPAQLTLLLAINRAILERWGMPPETVNVHNECMPGRTCPGKYLTGTQIRAALNSAWPVPSRRYRIKGTPVFQDQVCKGVVALYLNPGTIVEVDKVYPEGTAHLATGAGFIRLDQSVEAV